MTIRHFLFHRVNPQRDPLWDPMDPALFDKVIAHITQRFHVVQMESFADEVSVSDRPLATVTFDDGYHDNLEHAVPILKKHNCPASFYIVTDCIDKNEPTWTTIVDYLHNHSSKADRKGEEVLQLKSRMKAMNASERKKVLEELKRDMDDVEIPEMMLSWDDLRAMQEAGFVIGSHSKTHAPFATIDNDHLQTELSSSGQRIESELGQFPVSIAYPVGSFDARTKEFAQRAGYRLGLATGQEFQKGSVDRFEIPRTELYNEAWWKTKMRISGNLETLKKILGR